MEREASGSGEREGDRVFEVRERERVAGVGGRGGHVGRRGVPWGRGNRGSKGVRKVREGGG